jgi:hypothetical protein
VSLVIPISKEKARLCLDEAVRIADSASALPGDWYHYVTQVGSSPRKVDVTVLGCALLAKSCDKRIDPFVVKRGVSDRGYNMRGIAEGALLPARHRYGIDIGSTSSGNPVNSSTWLKPRTLNDVVTRHPESYNRLLHILSEVDKLDEDEALHALAVWVRIRRAITAAKRSVRITDTDADLALLLSACRTFVLENAESGARGQALVAAAFGLAWDNVITGKVTDPSRHWPGDVHAFLPSVDVPVVVAEVKQRPVDEGEVRNFIAECVSSGIGNIFYVIMHDKAKDHLEDIDPIALAAQNNCLFTLFEDVDSMMLAALSWGPRSMSEKVRLFVTDMPHRLAQVELSAETQDRWAVLTRSETIG